MAHALSEDQDHPHIDDRLLPWPKVKDITGLSRTTAWRLQKSGDFPVPVVISPGRVGWRESELRAWKMSRVPRGETPAKPKELRSFALQLEPDEREPSEPRAPTVQASRSPEGTSRRERQTEGQLRFDF